MLSALENGHDQLLDSVRPQQLMKLIEYYQQKDILHLKGKVQGSGLSMASKCQT